MATLYANQSVTLTELLDAITGLIRAATLLPAEAVIEYHGPTRPDVDLSSANRSTIVWFKYVDAVVDNDTGANRHALPANQRFEINVLTRGFQDGAMRDKILGRKHLAFRILLENAFFGMILHDQYDNAVGSEPPKPANQAPFNKNEADQRRQGVAGVGPRTLSIATMTCESLPAMDRPRPEQGCVETRIGVGIKTILRVTLDEAPLLNSTLNAPAVAAINYLAQPTTQRHDKADFGAGFDLFKEPS
jgi:hypothetical protein